MTSTRNTGNAPCDAAVGAAGRASMNASSSTFYSLIGGVLVLSAGCSPTATVANSPKPFEVRVVQVQQRDVPLYQEWIGTLDGFVNADIKAQVSGYLVQQAYTEGSFVRTGQLLFQIDPRPFQATLDQVRAQLAQSLGQLEQARAQLVQAEAQVDVAEANRGRTQLDVDRYTPLARQEAITQQDLDNAIQNNLAAKAQLRAAEAPTQTREAAVQPPKAAIATAQINLGFTRLASPIDGIPGIAELQVGALVSPASGAITTVSTVDPIKVYFTASEQRYLQFARRFPTATLRQADLQQWELELILSDGVVHPQRGRIYFADRRVDLKTGAIRLAGLFPNPGNSLRPGQYAKVRAATDVQRGALLVPQRAIMDLQGARQIAFVDGSNKVAIRTVTLGETVGVDWIVRGGAKPGERVVVEGLQKIRQGMLVDPQPFRNP